MHSLLKPNKNKKGSYTIKVKKDYALPKESLKEILKRIRGGEDGSLLLGRER